MIFFELIAGLALGVFTGVAIQTIAKGGGAIVGRENVHKAIEKEEKNNRGRFDDLKVTRNDPKFYD